MIEEILDAETRIVKPDKELIKSNPFPGIRPFNSHESHLFFGQDELSDQIIDKLRENHFVCLLGGAGVGKTSIINCGIKPVLLSGFLAGFHSNWEIFHIQPGNDPTWNLATALASSEHASIPSENSQLGSQIYYNVLKRGRKGLTEIINQFNAPPETEYLFFIDQFEDLFRLKYMRDDLSFYEEAIHYVNLFLEARKSTLHKIYFIISIRSDFTDDCVMFPALADLINDSNVIIPKMTRDQLKKVILGPLNLMNVKIDDTLLVQILNEAILAEDTLPRLQHALHKTYESWINLCNWNKPVTAKEFEAIGGIANSISVHANSIYDSLSEEDKTLCETIFKSITERGTENKGLSRPTSLKDLARIAKVSAHDITRVISLFLNPQAELLCSDTEELTEDSVISVSHVSLIRAWDRLKAWVEDEAISGQMYKQLAETSAAYQVGKTGLLRPPDLDFALNWKEKQQPTIDWAKRYNPAFERTLVFLKTSNEKYTAELELKKTQAKKAMRKVRSFSVILGSTALIALLLTIFSIISRRNAMQQKQQALEQKIEADVKSQKAEKISKEALEEKMKAEMAANEAEKQRMLALEQSKLMEAQKTEAEYNAAQAVLKTTETEQNLQDLSKQKDQIEQNAIQSNIQKAEAEKEKQEAFKKRMVVNALTLAVKANQLQSNKQLRALLSVYAYQFNSEYGGFDLNNDIYNALVNTSNDLGISPRVSMRSHSGAVNALCVSNRSNTLYSTGSDGKIIAWNLSEPSPSPHNIMTLNQRNLCISVSQSGRWVAVGSDVGSITVVDLNNPTSPVTLKGHTGAVFSLAFTRDEQQLFSTASDKTVLLWDLQSGSNQVIYKEQASVRVLTISPDGKFLAGGGDDGSIYLWDIKSNQRYVLSSDDSNPIYSLAFNASSTMLATGDLKGNISLWNPYARKFVRSLKGHTARVTDIKFSPDGNFMTSASYDGTAYLFDTRYFNNPPVVIREPLTWILSVAFSGDGRKLVFGTNKNEYLVSWPAVLSSMANAICPKLQRGFTTDEWNSYIGSDVNYEKPCD